MLKAKSSSPFSNFSLSFLKKPKVVGLIVFFIILAALPVALYEVQQQQEIRQHAASYQNNSVREYSCGSNVTIEMQILENPDCPSGNNPTINSFQSTAKLSFSKNVLGNTYTINWKWAKFFCPTDTATQGSACLVPVNGSAIASGTIHLAPGQSSTDATTGPENPQQVNASYNTCGWYQNDFGFEVLNSSGIVMCTYSYDADLGSSNANFSYCNTGNVCTLPSVTPTITDTPTPTLPVNTPTDSPSPLPSDTPTPTSSPSATPTFTITPTFTVTPTGTLTPTLSPTPTPTGTTPPPTNTPPPTIIVVKPTLPPTGPSNTIVAVGLVGVAISVLGLALLIGI